MRFTELEIAGAFLIDIEPHEDERGFFARTFDLREFAERGLVNVIAQCSTSFNTRRGTLRGMHYQAAPHEETKVVRCTQGAIYDVIADLRPASASFLKWFGTEISAANRRAVYVPPGVAHGFQTMVDDSEVYYQISTAYVPSASKGNRWDDPALGIQWPNPHTPILSDRDRNYPLLSET